MKQINRSNVKKVALKQSADSCNGRFTRVSGGFFDEIEELAVKLVKDTAKDLEPTPKVLARAHVKALIEETRKDAGLPPVKVTAGTLEVLEMAIAGLVREKVKAHPLTGVTLMGPR